MRYSSLVLLCFCFLGWSWIIMDHATVFLLPLVAEVLTFVFSTTLVIHHTCFRKLFSRRQCYSSSLWFPPFPQTVVCFSETCSHYHTWECTNQPATECEGDVGSPLGALGVSVTWWRYAHVEYSQKLVDGIHAEVLKQTANTTLL